jgi:hypothetical protein
METRSRVTQILIISWQKYIQVQVSVEKIFYP